jgi:type IX secretion system PorP/SprF family membrane protein
MITQAQTYAYPANASTKFPLYTMFWNSKSLFNPAASGVEHNYHVALMGREQWAGIKDGPRNGGVFYEMKSEVLHGGVGINYMYTTFFKIHQTHELNANYSYHHSLGNNRILSAGISGGITLMKYDFSMGDPLIIDKGNKTYYDFQFGLFYQSNHLQLGLSSNHFEHIELNSEKRIFSQICLYSSYRFDIGKILAFRPEILMIWPEFITDNLTLSSGFIFTLKERFWTGFTYRTDDTYGGMAGVDIAGKVRLGYLFETTTGVPGSKTYGNHELLVALMIN